GRAARRSGVPVRVSSTIHMRARYGRCGGARCIKGYMTSLAAIPAFGTLRPDALDALVADSRAARYRPGTVVRPGGAVVLLLAGTMVVEVTGASGTRMWPARWDGPVIVDKAAALSGAVPVGELLA